MDLKKLFAKLPTKECVDAELEGYRQHLKAKRSGVWPPPRKQSKDPDIGVTP